MTMDKSLRVKKGASSVPRPEGHDEEEEEGEGRG